MYISLGIGFILQSGVKSAYNYLSNFGLDDEKSQSDKEQPVQAKLKFPLPGIQVNFSQTDFFFITYVWFMSFGQGVEC